MSIKEFAEKYIKAELDAFNNGNFDALEALENPDVVYHIGPWPDVIGFEAHKQDILMRKEAVPDLKIELEYLTGESNLFILMLNEKGTQKTPIRIPFIIDPPRKGNFILVVGNSNSSYLGRDFEKSIKKYVSDLNFFSAKHIGGWFKNATRSDQNSYWNV